ncbi:SDR family oxidoreductase [Phaeodactylibacter sp.]|jgi:NADP-dependent 3-hydroxy acid dehydrogenase YdfG|uniref:SDR family oxidoreductase n=1 Tax=Phaeodactylibacter sp. TaxID=1940289 RepID=UPI0025DB0F6B|nr:SDR family oxidoreductase [Phaeodactylibacter sp.]MCI4651765.1 SDR family oxidoreductase [Phaeodactylibacter sp.]MCI5090636.1 SDR family oxidoreductase [Phaeodactylibacter sp.]
MAVELLANKKVLIVGATGGIGAEAAKMIKNSQGNVFITGRDQEKLKKVAKDNKIPDDQVFTMEVTDPESVQKVADQIHSKVDQIDILVNAAGVGYLKKFEQIEYEQMSRMIDINLKGAFLVMQAFLPPMKASKKGMIINIPGVLGRAPMAAAAAYAASKYGLNGMVKSLREELKRTEIRLSNLYLGGVDSEFWDDIDMPVNRDKFITAQEAGRAVWFMCQQPTSGVVSEMVIQPFNHQVI